MRKYEIMLIVDGSLDQKAADKTANDLKKILKSAKDYKVDAWGLKDLAYPIKKQLRGYYYVINFSNDVPAEILEYKRVALINKGVLRHLIINLEKDYGYKATINPKKVKRSAFRAERYTRIKESILAEQEKLRMKKDNTPVKLTDI